VPEVPGPSPVLEFNHFTTIPSSLAMRCRQAQNQRLAQRDSLPDISAAGLRLARLYQLG